VVHDAESTPNGVGNCPSGAQFRTDDVVVAPQEISWSQNHPSKVSVIIPRFITCSTVDSNSICT